MGDRLNVRLDQVGPAAFEAEASSGGRLVLDGAPAIGGEGRGMRPMELLLTALAGCAAMDVVHILRRQRQELKTLAVEVVGARADAVPAVFTSIHLRFVASGEIDERKLQRAVALSVDKYCSVGKSLSPDVQISREAVLEG